MKTTWLLLICFGWVALIVGCSSNDPNTVAEKQQLASLPFKPLDPSALAEQKRRPADDSTPPQSESFAERFRESRFLRKPDLFLSANQPKMVTAQQAHFLRDQDEVLGFFIGRTARAYPVRMLCYHHVVNDRIGDKPLMAAY